MMKKKKKLHNGHIKMLNNILKDEDLCQHIRCVAKWGYYDVLKTFIERILNDSDYQESGADYQCLSQIRESYLSYFKEQKIGS